MKNDTTGLRTLMREPRSVEDSVTEALRVAIENGELEPGTRLGQVRLAEDLGVSRIPLRDAFRRLAAEGLIEIDGRRGARVARLSAADVAEIYEMRILLEGACVRHAIHNMGPEDLDELAELADRMDEAASDPATGRDRRLEFYACLYAHAHRPRMRETILRLRSQVRRYHLLNRASDSTDAHRRLMDRITAGDADGAADVIATHLANARDDLVASMPAPSDD